MTFGFLLFVGGLALLYAGVKGHSVGDILQGTGIASADVPFLGSNDTQALQEATASVSGVAGVISPIPAGAAVQWKRNDQGVDAQLKPGQVLRAIDSGTVSINSDPSGFGTHPILHTSHGDYYYGHTVPAVGAGPIKKGQIISTTSTTGQNAPPGWLEFGKLLPGGRYPSMQAGARIRQWLLGLPQR